MTISSYRVGRSFENVCRVSHLQQFSRNDIRFIERLNPKCHICLAAGETVKSCVSEEFDDDFGMSRGELNEHWRQKMSAKPI